LGDLKEDTSKVTVRLNEILKTKATEKMLAKIGTSIEEMKKDSLNDMKTLSTMNTTLQVVLESVPLSFINVWIFFP
jgi:hypothetical protein